jgi:NAD(P)-dependent dehydrogenase (short-subunit alcohol dehydrogenase family)
VLALEYSRFGITSNVISLGYFDGPLWDEIPEQKRANLLMSVPSRQLGHSSNLTNSILFLTDSNYINGSVIKVDGGL